MGIRIETRKTGVYPPDEEQPIDNSLTEIFSSTRKKQAIERAKILKGQRPLNHIRVIEFRNDEPDETRTACKVLFKI